MATVHALLGDVLRDIRFGLRALARSPSFTAVAVLSLALAIGVNTAVFSVVNAIFLRPAPVADASTVVRVYTDDPKNPGHLPRRTSHIDVDHISTGRFRQSCTRGEPMRLTSRQLHDKWKNHPIIGRSTHNIRTGLGQFLTRHHL